MTYHISTLPVLWDGFQGYFHGVSKAKYKTTNAIYHLYSRHVLNDHSFLYERHMSTVKCDWNGTPIATSATATTETTTTTSSSSSTNDNNNNNNNYYYY